MSIVGKSSPASDTVVGVAPPEGGSDTRVGTGVFVGGTGVFVGGTGVSVGCAGGTGVFVGCAGGFVGVGVLVAVGVMVGVGVAVAVGVVTVQFPLTPNVRNGRVGVL